MKYAFLILTSLFLFATSFLNAQENLALGKKTWQTSDYGGVSGLAVDGNTDGNYYNGSITHTNTQKGAYWQVDLGTVHDIRTIKLYNRTDCCADRLNNFTILVTDDGNWYNATLFADGALYTNETVRTFTGNRRGRWVRVMLNGTDYLSLAEVEVYSESTPTQTINIGDELHGGIVFYVDETGQHGKVAAAVDQATGATWNEAYELCLNLDLGGYTDWSFPSSEELNSMYINLHEAGLGNFAGWYWNSTELAGNDDVGGNQSFYGGDRGYDDKENELYVRATRSF